MKTKAFFVTTLMLLPVFVFGQDLYDDLYYKPGKDKPLKTEQAKPVVENEVSPAQNDQYRIESTKVGDKDMVVVRNMNGDTVYYSGDNKEPVMDNSQQVSAANGEYANRIKRFHSPDGDIIINDNDTLAAYPLDNVNWTINVNSDFGGGGWPYWG